MQTNKTKSVRIALVCQECGKTWRVSPNAADPQCPKCGGVDFEVKDDVIVPTVSTETAYGRTVAYPFSLKVF